jgi:hypothetical protein
MQTLARIAKNLSRSTVYLRALQNRFELPVFEGAAYSGAYLALLRTILFITRSLHQSATASADSSPFFPGCDTDASREILRRPSVSSFPFAPAMQRTIHRPVFLLQPFFGGEHRPLVSENVSDSVGCAAPAALPAGQHRCRPGDHRAKRSQKVPAVKFPVPAEPPPLPRD